MLNVKCLDKYCGALNIKLVIGKRGEYRHLILTVHPNTFIIIWRLKCQYN